LVDISDPHLLLVPFLLLLLVPLALTIVIATRLANKQPSANLPRFGRLAR
jgi:hypothetical protein